MSYDCYRCDGDKFKRIVSPRCTYLLQAFLSPTARLQHATGAREVIPPVLGTKFMQPDKSEQPTQAGVATKLTFRLAPSQSGAHCMGFFPSEGQRMVLLRLPAASFYGPQFPGLKKAAQTSRKNSQTAGPWTFNGQTPLALVVIQIRFVSITTELFQFVAANK